MIKIKNIENGEMMQVWQTGIDKATGKIYCNGTPTAKYLAKYPLLVTGETAYPLTNPSMLRRHSFRFTEITKGVHKAFASGYGSANRRADELLKACGLRDAKVLSYYKMRGQTTEQITKDILS